MKDFEREDRIIVAIKRMDGQVNSMIKTLYEICDRMDKMIETLDTMNKSLSRIASNTEA